MKSFLHFKITLLMISALVPWPELKHPTSSCSREFSFIVRKFVEKKWTPIFERFKVDIPLSCPLNPERDIFHVFHHSKFPVSPRKWSCGVCGKAFQTELFLDLHLLRKHSEKLHLAEDTVCPAEFCDLIRCEVLQYAELSRNRNNNTTGDSEGGFQNSKERQQTITALVKAAPQVTPLGQHHRQQQEALCLSDDEDCRKKGWLMLPSSQPPPLHCCLKANATSLPPPCKNESSAGQEEGQDIRPPSSKEEELSERIRQKQSACRDDDFVQLRMDCSRLIDLCTSGLILRMTNQQFNHLRDDLNRSVCWHLQCDRYWTEVLHPEAVTSTLLLMAMAFSVVGFACSYIIVCVVCQDPPSLRPRRKSHRSGTSGGQSSSRSARNSYNGTSTDPWVMGDSSTTSSIGSSAAVQRVKRPTSGILHSSRSHYSGTRRFDHSGTFVIEADVEENSLI